MRHMYALVGLVSFALSGSVSANLITNGGFETGSLSGWTSAALYCSGVGTNYSNASGGCVGQDTNPGPHSGTYSLYLGPNPSFGTVSQTVATSSGSKYAISFWLADSTYLGTSTPNEFKVSWGGNTLMDLVNVVGAFGYTQYVFDVIATSNTSTLEFAAINWPSAFNLDDVSVTNVPEPASLALLGLGLLGLVVSRKRKIA